jgi:hypothetical protein
MGNILSQVSSLPGFLTGTAEIVHPTGLKGNNAMLMVS